MSAADDVTAQVNEALRGIAHSKTITNKYTKFNSLLASITGLDLDDIYTSWVSLPGRTSVRLIQSGNADSGRLVVALVGEPDLVEKTVEKVQKAAQKNDLAASYLVLAHETGKMDHDGWYFRVGLEPRTDRGDILSLLNSVDDALDGQLPRQSYEPNPRALRQLKIMIEQRNDVDGLGDVVAVPIELDARTLRLFRSAVASSRAVMLVGPPGTGKSSLVHQMMRDLQDNPAAYGMTKAHSLKTVTADESWTIRDLVGGDSVGDDGTIRFSPGYVLDALAQNRWLLIDEANRADLDRVFGGLLSWLTEQSVTIGKLAPGSSLEIKLGWCADVDCDVPDDLSERSASAGALRYKAGTEWRLIGTYNSLDANRVFRFGLALGRRFSQVPISAPPSSLFRSLVGKRILPDGWNVDERRTLIDRLVALYEAHQTHEGTILGPAPFLRIPPSIAFARSIDQVASLDELLAEAYLSTFGLWLARLEKVDTDALGLHLDSPTCLNGQWHWVRAQLDAFA